MYVAIKKGNILVNILLLKILSLIYPVVNLHNKIYVGWVIVDPATELCQKSDFFLKKRMKGIFVYVLELILTTDEM